MEKKHYELVEKLTTVDKVYKEENAMLTTELEKVDSLKVTRDTNMKLIKGLASDTENLQTAT